MSPEQQKALALARARQRQGEGSKPAVESGEEFMSAPPPGMQFDPATGQMFDPAARAEVVGNPVIGALKRTAAVADDAARMVANGATFGLADKAAGAMDAVTGQAGSYDEGVRGQRAETQRLRDEHPYASGGAELAGGLLGGVGLAKSGLTLAGRVGAGLIPRMAAFGAEGAAYGAAHGAGNTYSDDAGDYARNAGAGAKWGTVLGGALPVAGAGLSGLMRLGSAVAGPSIEGAGRTASSLLRGAAQADAQGLQSLSRMGDQGMLVDAGPSMLGLGQGAGTGTGAGRSELVNALRTRDAGTNDRILGALDQTLGPAPVPSQIRAGIDQSKEAVGSQYQQLPFNAPADTAPLAGSLDDLSVQLRGPAQSAVRKVRGYLDEVPDPNAPPAPKPPPGSAPAGPQLAGDAGTLFQTRQAIDGLLATENDPKVIRQLTMARQSVDEILDHSVPGLKAVDGQFQEVARQGEALTRGSQIFDKGKEAIRPVELQQEIQQGALPQNQMIGPSGVPYRIRQGARAEIDRLVGTNANDLNTLERTLATPNDWNSQKFAAVFGEPQRETVAEALGNNRKFRQSYQDIVQGSQTAQRQTSQKLLDGEIEPPTDVTMTGAALTGAKAIWRALSGLSREATKDDVGKILAKQGPDAQRIMQELLQHAAGATDRSAIARALIANPGNAAAAGQYGGRR